MRIYTRPITHYFPKVIPRMLQALNIKAIVSAAFAALGMLALYTLHNRYSASLAKRQIKPILVRPKQQLHEAPLFNKEPPKPLREATSPEEVIQRLKYEWKRIHTSDVEELIAESAQFYPGEPIEDSTTVKIDRALSRYFPWIIAPPIRYTINEKSIFKQINFDLERNHEGGSRLILNGTTYDGSEGKDAQAILDALSAGQKTKQEALQLMTLLQQGVFASLQKKITQDLELGEGMDASFQISGQGNYLDNELKEKREKIAQLGKSEATMELERNAFIREYRVEGNKITCSCKFEITAANIEKKSIYRDLPYGVIDAQVTLNLDENTARETWEITKTISS